MSASAFVRMPVFMYLLARVILFPIHLPVFLLRQVSAIGPLVLVNLLIDMLLTLFQMGALTRR